MELILDFLVDNYLWFLIISLILVFGLIGYLVDTKEKKTPEMNLGNEENLNEASSVSVNNETVEAPLENSSQIVETPVLNTVSNVEGETQNFEAVSNNINAVSNDSFIKSEDNIQEELPLE